MPSFSTCALVALTLLLFALGGIIMWQDGKIKELHILLWHANKPSPLAPLANNTLGDFEALQGAYKTSQDTIRRLQATINHLENASTKPRSERRARGSAVELSSRVECIQAASDGKDKVIRSLSVEYHSSLDTIRRLERTIDSTHDEMTRLQRTNADQATAIWQRDQTVAKFNHVKEAIHRLTAAGGPRMVVTVLFVGLLAQDFGVDLAELGIDHLRFQSYYVYAEAQALGLISQLLPVGGFRLEGTQYALSGLRVVGARIVEPWCTFVAPSAPAAPAFAAPSVYGPATNTTTITALPPLPPLAPATVAPPAAPVPPAVLRPAVPVPVAAPLPVAPVPAVAPPQAIAVPVAAAPPAQNQRTTGGFQSSKRPGSFGVSKR